MANAKMNEYGGGGGSPFGFGVADKVREHFSPKRLDY